MRLINFQQFKRRDSQTRKRVLRITCQAIYKSYPNGYRRALYRGYHILTNKPVRLVYAPPAIRSPHEAVFLSRTLFVKDSWGCFYFSIPQQISEA